VSVIGGTLGTHLLTRIAGKNDMGALTGAAYRNRSKLEVLLGDRFFDRIQGRTVIDFGCGHGQETVEMAQRGAAHVIGVDICEAYLERARGNAAAAGVADRCTFTTTPDRTADIVVSLDSFEHFEDPAAILRVMDRYLAPGGVVVAVFGPTWYHPYGGHLFSVFPWAHLVFTEKAMLEWRKTFRPTQTARTITEVGLNKITIRQFERLVDESPFRFAEFEARPIRSLRRLSTPLTREFCTSVVRCTLERKTGSHQTPPH
jgi:2-polyprenyl-3-methyl-5-hydroxy-6-metoxy-1,4-benzoquinol methylase